MTAIAGTRLDARALTGGAALVVLLVAGALLYLVLQVRPLEWQAPPAIELSLAGERYRISPAELEQLESFSTLHFAAGADAARELAAEEIAARLDPAFARARARLPAFADWYYSLRGEYSRLAMAALSVAHLAEPGYVAARAGEMLLPEQVWERDLAALQRAAEARLAEHNGAVRAEWLAEVTRRLAPHRIPAPLPGSEAARPALAIETLLADLEEREQSAFRTRVSLSALAAAGAAAGPAVWSAATARRAAAGGRAVAARAGGRAAARAGSAAAGGAAVCSPSGLGALACGLVAGTAVWLGADWALLRVDEHFNRDELLAALDTGLTELRVQIENALLEAYDELIATHYGQVQDEIRDGFVPAHAGR